MGWKVRTIKVKADQAIAVTRYRKGYFAIDPAQWKDANTSGRRRGMEFLRRRPISFMAQGSRPVPGKVRVVFLVDAHTLSSEDSGGSKKMNVSLYASVYGSNGKSLADAQHQGGSTHSTLPPINRFSTKA